MKIIRNQTYYFIISALFSIILTNIGIALISDFPEKPLLGIMTIILAFLLLYFSGQILQVKTNEENIRYIQKQIAIIQNTNELNEKVLNTLREIVLLENTKKRNEK